MGPRGTVPKLREGPSPRALTQCLPEPWRGAGADGQCLCHGTGQCEHRLKDMVLFL